MTARRARPAALAGAAVLLAAGLAACGGTLPVSASRAAPPAGATTSPPTAPPATSTPPATAPPASTPATAPDVPTLGDPHDGATVYRTVIADAEAKRWVHAVSTGGQPGSTSTLTITGQAGPAEGTQVIRAGSDVGDVRVLGSRTWIRGSAPSLTALFGVPAADAASLADHWVVLNPSDGAYATITAGVALASLLQEVAFDGAVTAGTATLDGRTTTTLEGILPSAEGTGEGVLYVTDGSDPLPVEWDEVGSKGTARLVLSAWGAASTVTAPSGAVSLPSIPGTTEPADAVRPDGAR